MERAVNLSPPKPTRPSWLLLAQIPESHSSREEFLCPSFIMPNFHSYYKPPELHIPMERSRFAILADAMAAGVPGSLKKNIYCLLLWPTVACFCNWPVRAHMHMFILLQSCSSLLPLCCVHPLSIILYKYSGFFYTTWFGLVFRKASVWTSAQCSNP